MRDLWLQRPRSPLVSIDMAPANANLSPQMHSAIRRRAEEIYYRSGCIAGRDLDNWQQAEAEILQELAGKTLRCVVVKVQGVLYTGQYDCASADGYTPGEFRRGEPVAVRLQGNNLFLRRPNGRELQTKIVHRTG